MKVIIAGKRDYNNHHTLLEAIKESGFEITEVVSGGANGVDRLGEQWAEENNIPVKVFPADWDKWGYAAGPKRNRQMASYAEALIALYDGSSRGTTNMISEARYKNLKVYVKKI